MADEILLTFNMCNLWLLLKCMGFLLKHASTSLMEEVVTEL